VQITINQIPVVNAGPDQTICSNAAANISATLTGGATTGIWTTNGSGTFANNTSLNTTYTPNASDYLLTNLTLTFTSADPAGPCPAASDALVLTINPAAVVSAGLDQTICSNQTVSLAGVISGGATTVLWSGGAGSYNSSNTALNPIYTPTPAELGAGILTLTITSNDPTGPCGPASDQVQITINQIPVVNAGPDQTICSNAVANISATLTGGATTGTWTTSGSGTFANNTSLNTTYTPSTADYPLPNLTLTFTSADPTGPCPAVSDALVLTINPAAFVNAGLDQTICSNQTV
jgi:hypothetical protein